MSRFGAGASFSGLAVSDATKEGYFDSRCILNSAGYTFCCGLIAGVVAQLAERLNRIQEVVSSILIHSTEISRRLCRLAGFSFLWVGARNVRGGALSAPGSCGQIGVLQHHLLPATGGNASKSKYCAMRAISFYPPSQSINASPHRQL